MLNKIIRYSLNNRLLILVASVLLLFAGLYTSMKMDVDVFPDLNAPTVVVMTEAPGMAPEEVERLVTFPVETALNGATDVRRVRSSSTTGFSVVWVEFDWGTDIYRARQITSEKLAVVGESLPEGVGTPTLGPQSSILGEMMIIGLTSDSTSLRDLRTLADWTIRPRLLSIGGVAQVTVIGGEMKEYQILLDLPRMKQYGVTLDEVLNAAREMNRNANGGILYEYGNEYIVRGAVATTDVDAIAKAVVKRVDGVPVLMGDVAEVKIGDKAPKLGYGFGSGQSCRFADSYQAAQYEYSRPHGKTAFFDGRVTEKYAGRCHGFDRYIPSVSFYREFHKQCTKVLIRRGYIRSDRSVFLLDECAYDAHFVGRFAVVFTVFYIGAPFYGVDHQYDEPRWYGHSHRIFGR